MSVRECLRISVSISLAFLLITGASVSHSAPIDDVIANMKPGEWYEVPNSAMRSVVMNPLPDGIHAVEGPGAVIHSWSGGALDSKRNKLIVWGGGHNAYAGNEVYAFDINMLTWSRLTDPSSISGYTNGDATYPDGRPISVHSYDQVEYDPVADRLFTFGGSRYSNGYATSASYVFDIENAIWKKVGDIPGSSYSEIQGLSLTSAYDPVTGLIYVGGKYGLATYDVTSNNWNILGTNYGELSLGMTAALDYKRRKLVQIGRGQVNVWDISTMIPSRTTPVTTGDTGIVGCDAPGVQYDPVSDRIVAWCNGSDVYALNLDNNVWTKYSATSSVSPGDVYHPNYHGTFGRFRYVPSKNIFVVVTHIDKNVFVYKLTDGNNISLPSVTLNANPDNVLVGDSANLLWSSTNAVTCNASNGVAGWSGVKNISGTETVGPINSTTTFTLSCTNSDGQVAGANAVVTVASNNTEDPVDNTGDTGNVTNPPDNTSAVSVGESTEGGGGSIGIASLMLLLVMSAGIIKKSISV